MQKTNQILGKVYQTSLDGTIEDLKPDSTCQATTKKMRKKIRKFDLDRRQNAKGQHKGKKKFCIFTDFYTARYKKKYRWKASELFKGEGFSKCR